MAYEVLFQWSDFRHTLDLVFIDRTHDGNFIAKPVELICEKVPFGRILQPTLSIEANLGNSFLKSAVKFAADNNIKPDSEHALKGKLDATSYHLEDLRKMLKLTK